MAELRAHEASCEACVARRPCASRRTIAEAYLAIAVPLWTPNAHCGCCGAGAIKQLVVIACPGCGRPYYRCPACGGKDAAAKTAAGCLLSHASTIGGHL
jgi:hypothetical protein